MGIQYTPRGRRFMWIMMPILILNMLSCFVGTFILGGDALYGYIEDGHYFVTYKGEIAEVTSPQWIYSYIHVRLMITNFLVFIAFVFWFWISGDIDA
jgi:hypothetical protein